MLSLLIILFNWPFPELLQNYQGLKSKVVEIAEAGFLTLDENSLDGGIAMR